MVRQACRSANVQTSGPSARHPGGETEPTSEAYGVLSLVDRAMLFGRAKRMRDRVASNTFAFNRKLSAE
jgi:hypothetical protein